MDNTLKDRLLRKLDRAVQSSENNFNDSFFTKLSFAICHPKKMLLQKVIVGFLSNRKTFVLKTRTFFGSIMYVNNYEPDLWFYGAISSPAEVCLTKYILKNIDMLTDGSFFDIGAHHGFYALLVNAISQGRVQVHAFEPAHSHFFMLQKSVKNLKNMFINNMAVYSRSGSVRFFESERTVSTLYKDFADSNTKKLRFEEVEVPALSLDDYCRDRMLSPTFLKIDVEGAETDVLLGAKETLHVCNPVIAMEVWKGNNEGHLRAAHMLIELGYKPFQIDDRGDLVGLQSVSSAIISDMDGFVNLIFKR